jgi:hypothetical protein
MRVIVGLALAALISPPALAEDGATAQVDLTATVVPPPFCVITLFACDVGYTGATLWGAVASWPPPYGVTTGFGWDTVSHKDHPADYPNWKAGNKIFLDMVFHASLSGLRPGTNYFFRARAQRGDYTGYGEELCFTTPPEFRAITLPATDIKPKLATLNGMTIGQSRSPKVKVSFGWDSRSHESDPDGYLHWTAPKSVYAGDTFNYKLSNLTQETTYYFRVRAERGGFIYYGEEKRFTTPLEIRAITLPATDIKSKQATLNGTTFSEFKSPKAKVSFGWDTEPYAVRGNYRNWTSSQNAWAGDTFAVKLTKLRPNTTYYFRARAERNGIVSYGDELSFTTPP